MPQTRTYRTTRLVNGVQVATANLEAMSSVCLGLWVNVGGRHEQPQQNGAAHFIEHMLFKGTKRRTAQAISEEIEGLGGYLNAFTSEENTCYYARASAPHSQQMLDVLMDMFLHAQFQQDDIDRERAVILEENAMYLDQPNQLVLEKLNEVLWPGHALGRPITGTTRTLRQLNRRRLLAFRRQFYHGANVLVAAAGPVDHSALVRWVKALTTPVRPGSSATFVPAPTSIARSKHRVIKRDVEQVQLAICFPTWSRHDSRRYALQVLNTILGENMSSRLFQVLREDHGLAYSVYSSIGTFADTGTLTITAGLDPDKLAQTMRLTDIELRRLSREAIPTVELDRAKQYLIGQLDLHLESTENHMIWIGEQLLGYGRIRPLRQIRERLLRVTADEIRGLATECFTRNRVRIAAVGPRETNLPAALKGFLC